MKNYLTLEVVRIVDGHVCLSADQARRRTSFLATRKGDALPADRTKIEDGIFTVVNPVQFKAGEIIGIGEAAITRVLEASLFETGQKPATLKGDERVATLKAANETIAEDQAKAAKTKAAKERQAKAEAAIAA